MHARVESTFNSAGSCPSDEMLVGLVQAALPERQARRIRSHLLACTACRELSAELAAEDAIALDRPGDPVRAARPSWVRWAAAAAAACAAVALVLWGSADSRPRMVTQADRVAAIVAQAAAADPELFSGFEPLSEAELDHLPPLDTERGGVVLRRPQRTVTSLRPEFSWNAAPGAQRHTVTLRDGDGRVLWQRSVNGGRLSYPEESALASGRRYLWSVTAAGVTAQFTGRATFLVASEDARRELTQIRVLLKKTANGDAEARLVEAQFAIRLGCLLHARDLLPQDSGPPDSLASRTRKYIRRHLPGAP